MFEHPAERYASTFVDTICPGTDANIIRAEDIVCTEEHSAINLFRRKLMHLIWQTSLL